ncbi:MAG: sulfotransferase, partial [Myxococcales bacterium]|nr:sulfotransferase [Myxococcales bacterium]
GVEPRWASVVGAGPRLWIPPHPHERRRCRNADLVPLAGDRPLRGAAPASSPSSTRAALAALDPTRRREAVAGWLSEQLANLGVADVAGRSSSAFGDLGLDSLAIVELIQAAQRDLGIQLYPDELFSAPSLDGLASRLAQAIDGGRVGSEPAQEAAASARASAERLAATALVAPPFAQPARRLPGAVLLLSAPRCGSTLLRVMLAGHPRLFAPPELHLLAYPDMRAWHDALAPRMLHLGLVQALVGAGVDEAAATAKIARWRDEATPTSAVYAALMELLDGRRLVDKSPSYALDPRILERAEALFDRPRYVILSRHPAAMIESFTRLRMGRLFAASDVDPHLFAEAIWTRAYAALEAFAARVGARARWIRYEELVADPATSAAQLCEFLDLAPDPGVLTPYAGQRMVPDAGGAISFIGDPNFTRHRAIDAALGERWREVRLPWRFGQVTADLAARLGYAAAASRGTGEDLEADARLPDDLEIAASPAAAGELLLTGATGFLGGELVDVFLSRGWSVRAFVRATSRVETLEARGVEI